MFKKQKSRNNGRNRLASPTSGASAPVVRYYRPDTSQKRRMGDDQLEKARIEQQKPEHPFRRVVQLVWRWSIVGVIIGFLIINTTLSGVLIKTAASSNAYQPPEVYETKINDLLRSSFRSRSKLLLNSSRFEAQIQAEFPEVANATAVIPLAGRTLQIGLEFAEPLLRLQMPQNQQGIVSQNGILVFSDSAAEINATYASLPSLSIPLVDFKQKEQVLTSDEANLLALLMSEFDGSASHRPAISSVEFDVKKREMKVRFKSEAYYAKLTPEREARAQIGALVAILNEMTDKGLEITDYVDVRVEGRVFIK